MTIIRNFRESDIPQVVQVFNAGFEADGMPERINEELVQFQLKIPLMRPEEDFFVAEADGKLIGFAMNQLNPRTGAAGSNVEVLPEYRGGDVAIRLITIGDETILKRANAETPADKPVYIMRQAIDNQQSYITALEQTNHELVRHFYEMFIEFTPEMSQPEFPAGVEMRPFNRADHARAVHQAQQEAFRDHWGFVEERPFDEWQVRFDNPHHDDALYFIAWDGDQVAGIAFCSVGQMGETDLGHVDILGVRRPWRGKGLGMALLRYAFCSFQGLGLRGSTLGVDAASKTNAVALYERAGMSVRRHAIAYRKVLRGNLADIVD